MRQIVVVTDGEQRSALATVRALGSAGHIVHVCSSRKRSLAGASRFASSESRVPDPLQAPAEYVNALCTLCLSVGASVLLPISEPSLLAVLPQRDRFACNVPFPSSESFSAVCDKERVLDVAECHGLKVPRQHILIDASGARDLVDRLVFPVVLKPARSVAGPAGRRVKVGVTYAHDRSGLVGALEAMLPEAYPVLLQERIEGPGFAISLLIWNGTILAAFGHERLREKPPSGGVSVLRKSIPLDHKLMEQSARLLAEFQWRGVAMVEFKRDAGAGTAYLMEINGRLWGSLQLAIDAGVNFPLLLVQAAMSDDIRPVLSYDVGVQTRWELGDLDHLLTRLRRSPKALNLPPSAPSRWRAVAEFVGGFGPRNKQEVLRLTDPRPFVHEVLTWLRGR